MATTMDVLENDVGCCLGPPVRTQKAVFIFELSLHEAFIVHACRVAL